MTQYFMEKWEFREELPPIVTIEPNILRFEPEVARKLGLIAGSRVNLFFDRKRNLIGIRLKRGNDPAQPYIKTWKESWSIRARRFFADYNIQVTYRKRFYCRWDSKEKMVIIDLQKAVPPGRREGA